MGFFGRVTGWDHQKAAHNAVLANHLAETASPELRREIVARLVIIQQQVGAGIGDAPAIVAQLSCLPRIVQMNFIALACNSLGIPSGVPGQSFAAVDNPYRADDDSSLQRIGVALDDLSRRSGRRLSWPGNAERIDFLAWGSFPRSMDGAEVRPDAAKASLNPEYAAHLAYRNLLAEAVHFETAVGVAKELAPVIGASSDKELALATALFFFEQEDLRSALNSIQMMARLTMLDWLQEGSIQPAAGGYFEEQLYSLYQP